MSRTTGGRVELRGAAMQARRIRQTAPMNPPLATQGRIKTSLV